MESADAGSQGTREGPCAQPCDSDTPTSQTVDEAFAFLTAALVELLQWKDVLITSSVLPSKVTLELIVISSKLWRGTQTAQKVVQRSMAESASIDIEMLLQPLRRQIAADKAEKAELQAKVQQSEATLGKHLMQIAPQVSLIRTLRWRCLLQQLQMQQGQRLELNTRKAMWIGFRRCKECLSAKRPHMIASPRLLFSTDEPAPILTPVLASTPAPTEAKAMTSVSIQTNSPSRSDQASQTVAEPCANCQELKRANAELQQKVDQSAIQTKKQKVAKRKDKVEALSRDLPVSAWDTGDGEEASPTILQSVMSPSTEPALRPVSPVQMAVVSEAQGLVWPPEPPIPVPDELPEPLMPPIPAEPAPREPTPREPTPITIAAIPTPVPEPVRIVSHVERRPLSISVHAEIDETPSPRMYEPPSAQPAVNLDALWRISATPKPVAATPLATNRGLVSHPLPFAESPQRRAVAAASPSRLPAGPAHSPVLVAKIGLSPMGVPPRLPVFAAAPSPQPPAAHLKHRPRSAATNSRSFRLASDPSPPATPAPTTIPTELPPQEEQQAWTQHVEQNNTRYAQVNTNSVSPRYSIASPLLPSTKRL